MTADEFAAWLETHGLSDLHAARLFGLARGTIWRYRQSDPGDQRPVHPAVVRLCRLIDLAPKMFIPELERMAREEEKKENYTKISVDR